MTHTPALPIAILALPLALAACELRQEGEEEPAPDPVVEEPSPGETASPEPEGVSIIREDIEVQPVIEEPPEPLSVTVPFGQGGNDLSERAERILAGVLDSDALEEGWPVILRGHTDSSGNDEANLRASRARAEAVAAWLVERGVDDERIEVIAFGEQNPIAPNALPSGEPNEAGRARNRRVEIEIAPDGGAAQDAEEEDVTAPEDA